MLNEKLDDGGRKKKISINNDFAVNDSFIENGEEHLAFLAEI